MVDDVVYLVTHELMQNRHGDSSVGQRGEEGYGPLAGIASAEGYLVTLHHAAVLEQNM